MIRFTVPGTPQGKARARTVYNPRIKRSVSYTPDNTILYENLVKAMYLQECQGEQYMDGQPLQAVIEAHFEPPKSVSKKKRAEMLEGLIKPCKKPDADNIAKVVLDALNGLAYKDDTQICSLTVQKEYREQTGVEVYIYEDRKAGE